MKIIYKILFFILPLTLYAEPIPRHILAFWDSEDDKIVEDSLVHRTLEMPLNHLGLDVIYQDIQKPLPTLSEKDGIRGILVSFQNSTAMRDPEKFIDWAVHAIDLGKKVVLMGNVGFLANLQGDYTSGDIQNRLFEKLGFTNNQIWVDYPFDYQVLMSEKELFPFERNLPQPLLGFYQTRVYESSAKSYLRVGLPGKPESEADLVIIGPHGGYISDYYANSFDPLLFVNNPRSLGWYLNPFQFFEIAFDVSGLPIPDTTTLAGRRIFISTCHGDNWNAETSIEEYQGKEIYNAEIILEKIVKPNPDLPIAMGLVAADFDPNWASKKRSQATAKLCLSLPQVEAASHTYSHPFFWDFFRTGGAEKEMDYLSFYPYGSWQNSFLSWFRAKMYQVYSPKEYAKRLKWGYFLPRAYANEKFNLEKEISGSINFLNNFAPQNNKIKLLIWSGDSRPWDEPVRLCEKAGVKNYGGGYVRFDAEHPSNLFVYPLCRKPGGIIQLYSAANAENAYTDNWKDNFYGFEFLPATLKNTENPRRLKPIHLYFHAFSGEFDASVNAILRNIAFIRTQSPIPIQVGRYCDIGNGFFTVSIERIGNDVWKIHNRQGLQTIRFDRIKNQTIDFTNSTGVIGYGEHQGSLYIYLDASIEEPVIALSGFQDDKIPYLIDSNWEIWNLKRDVNRLDFNSSGWGKLSMRWKMPKTGAYGIVAAPLGEKIVETTNEGILEVNLDLPYNIQTQISIIRR